MFRLRGNGNGGGVSDTDSSENENILLNIGEEEEEDSKVTGESSRTGKNIYNDDDIIRIDGGDRYIFNPYNTEL